jgi:hypothetical protein
VDWSAKHILSVVGIKLFELGLFPHLPVGALLELSAREASSGLILSYCIVDSGLIYVWERAVVAPEVIVVAIAHHMQVMCNCVQLIEVQLWYAGRCQWLRDFVMGDGDFATGPVGLQETLYRQVDVLDGVNVFTVNRTDCAMSETASPVFEFCRKRAGFAGLDNRTGSPLRRVELKSEGWVTGVDTYGFRGGGPKDVE